MIKPIREGLAVNTDYVVAIVTEDSHELGFPFKVVAYMDTLYSTQGTYDLEWFETAEDADAWIEHTFGGTTCK